MGCAAMDVAAGQGEPRADRKLMGRARGTAQNDFGGKNVSGKARQGRDLYPDEFTEGVADLQMMRCDMQRYSFHSPRNYLRRCERLRLLID